MKNEKVKSPLCGLKLAGDAAGDDCTTEDEKRKMKSHKTRR